MTDSFLNFLLDGQPLRGEEIASKINEPDADGIKQIDVLKKPAAYRIYGIRAINGVMLVTAKR
jgi:TonB-dependent SusC/RagA subfamily outer membrane receptor